MLCCSYFAHYAHKPRDWGLVAYWSSLGFVWLLFVVVWGCVPPSATWLDLLSGRCWGCLVPGVGFGVWFVDGLPAGVAMRRSLLFLVVIHPVPSTLALMTCLAVCWAFLLSATTWNLFCSCSDRLYQHAEHWLLISSISLWISSSWY